MSLKLVVLVADGHQQATLETLLGKRCSSLGIQLLGSADFQIIVHPQKDPGVWRAGAELLRPYRKDAAHALVVLDEAWSGSPGKAQIKSDIMAALKPVWNRDADIVVIEPELEAWVWGQSPHVEEVLGWKGRNPSLRDWLAGRGHWPTGQRKPHDPQGALIAALQEVRVPRSSALFRDLAETVSLKLCEDPSFAELVAILQRWLGTPRLMTDS